MSPLGYPLLADENIDPEVVAGLREQGKDVETVLEAGLGGRDDLEVLRYAWQGGRAVLTHDSDFGALATQRAEPYVGILFIRPGNIRPAVVLGMLAAVESLQTTAHPPFLIVAEQRADVVRVRVRCGG